MSETIKGFASIITRLILIVTGILVMAALVAGSLAMVGQYRQLHQALGKKATTLVQFMAQVSPLDILSLNFVEMNNDVKKVVLTDDEALYALMLNEQGIPLVHFFKDADPLVTAEVRELVKKRQPLAAIEVMKSRGKILEVTTPISAGEKHIGSATLGFSTEKMRRALMIQTTVIGLVMIAIIGLSVFLLRTVLRRILHPVQVLTTAALRISRGDLNVELTGTDRPDELGVLSRAFESMAGRLQELIAGLERQLRFVETLLRTIPVAVFYKDAEGRYLGCNEEFTKITGIPKEHIAGKTVFELWPGDLSETYHQQDLDLLKKPAIQVYDFKVRNTKGELLDVVYHKNVILDEQGRVAGIIGAFLDISERKRAEDALLRERALLEQITETSPVGISMVNREGLVMFANRQAEIMLGLKKDEITQLTYNAPAWRITDFDGGPFPDEQLPFRQVMTSKQTVLDVRHAIEWSDGRRVYLSINGAPLLDEAGNVEGVVFAMEDITRQKQAEDALRTSEQRYHDIFDNVLDGLYLLEVTGDGRFRTLEINPALEHSTGIPREQVIGKTQEETVPPEVAEIVNAKYRHCIEAGRPIEEEAVLELPAGRRYYHSTLIPMRDAGGRVNRIIGISRDITERKLAEEAMRKSEERYRQFFESSPISLWEESFTLGAEYFKRLRAEGIADFRGYFEAHPEAVEECIRMVRIVDVNKATLDLIGAKSKDELVAGLSRIFTKETLPLFREEIITLAEGGLHYEAETVHKTFSGKEISVIIRMSVVAGYEETLERVLVSIVDITERKRSEESLALLNFALNNVRDEAYLITEQARFEYVNEHSCRALGYAREELLGPIGVADVDPDFPAGRWQEHWRELRVQGSLTFEGRHRARDGRIYPVEISANYFEYGGRGYNLALVRDITERKRIDSALRASEQNLALHVNQTPLGVIEWDLDFKVTKWNPAAERIFGYSKIEALGCHASLIVPLAAKEQVDQVWSALVSQKGGLRSTNENRTKDGRTIYCEWYNTPLVDDHGRVIAVASLIQDVTERKAAEDELFKLSSAVEQSPVSVVITDTNGRIEYVNPKFTQVTGYGPEEVRGRNPRILKSGSTPLEEYQRLWSTITTGNVWNGTFCNRKKNGELFWEKETIAPVKNKAGDITHYIAIKEDISEMRRLEEQLRQAQKMEAIGTLAGGIAHDFNNILTAIIGYSNIVKMKMKPDDPQRTSIDQILASSDRAAHLTQGLLAFSRKQLISPRPVDLNDIVRSVEKLLRRIIGEDVALSTQLSEKNLIAMADTVQIEQVLMNFATNARDAMPHGGALTILTQEVMLGEDFVAMHGFGKPGRHALIAVSDTGEGIDEKTREHIFDPFFTTKEPGKGTGLGLAIVYGIVKQHNGNINVYSEPGRGTTFKIYLPLIVTLAEKEEEKAVVPPRGGTETILLAEDDKEVRDLTTMILKEYGYTVIEAVDGEDAVEKFKERSGEVDLLLLDVIMPHKSGKEAYDAIKALRPNVAALFISGYTADILDKKGISGEGFQFISKPVSPFELLRRIREILNRKKNVS